MNFPFYFGRETCPPVFRVYAETTSVERVTLLRAPGETDQQFVERTQRRLHRLWLRSGCKAACRIECVYEIPTPQQDPHFFDDERWMDIGCLRDVLNRPSEPADVRISCAKALNRIYGLVSPEVW
jgi:hypothetical protein